MKTQKEIREQIKKITESNRHVLDCGMAKIDINNVRALMQMNATIQLDVLYWVLNEKRPRFKCDDITQKNT